jgi:hypothetical protein
MDGQKFRRRAEFLFDCANQINNPEYKAGLERMAAHWIRMAEEAERKQQSPDDTQQVGPSRISFLVSSREPAAANTLTDQDCYLLPPYGNTQRQ